MAGGEGSRLRPLTNLRPKPMVPIVNRPIMEHIVRLVRRHGIQQVVATLQFMPQVIENYFGDGYEWGMDVSYAVEESPLGTAGSVKNAEEALAGERFMVISGDALTDIDLTKVLEFHESKGAAVTIALKRVDNPLEFGVVITDEDGRIQRFLEKPSWGQVFSDTINTGIYVVEPEVLEHIPAKEAFDFSSELFPLLMKKGFPLYGVAVDGYWCDVGNLTTYAQANKDVLDGLAHVDIPGVKMREDVWVQEGAQVDSEAQLCNKVVLGSNVKIRAGAEIGDYAVIGDNCSVDRGASVKHSVLWADTYVGGAAILRGAVVCRGADIRRRSTLEPGSVIGDEAMVGAGAVVSNDVLVYPFKRVEPGAVVSSSLIWESSAVGALFADGCVSGLVGVDITPELALKLAQAVGTTLPSSSHLVVSRDTSRAARMLKRAMVAGLNASGVNVRDLRVTSPTINRFTTRDSRAVGGIHVSASPVDVNTVEIHVYDKNGLDIGIGEEKKTERLYFRQEFRRSFFEEVGEIIYPPRALEYYIQGILDALKPLEPRGRRLKIVADLAHGMAALSLPQIAARWNSDLISLSPFTDAERTMATPEEQRTSLEELKRAVEVFHADFGVAFDPMAERITLVTQAGKLLDGNTALHAMIDLWCEWDTAGKPIGVSLATSRVIEEIAGRYGRQVIRAGGSKRDLSRLAFEQDVGFVGSQKGGYIFPHFMAAYDGVMSTGMLAKMLSLTDRDLDAVVSALPAFHIRESVVFCGSEMKGTVMRALAEETAGKDVEFHDGVRVFENGGWALVMPHVSDPKVNVIAEGPDDATVEELLGRYSSFVEEVISAG